MECSHKIIKLCRYVDVTDLLSDAEINSIDHIGMNFRKGIPDRILNKVNPRPPNLLVGEADMLSSFGINRQLYFSSLWKAKNNKKISAKWCIVISNLGYIKKLLEVGIPLPEKEKKIREVVDSYTAENILLRKTYADTYALLKRIAVNGIIKRKELVERMVMLSTTKYVREKVDRHIKIMLQHGLIKRVSKGTYSLARFNICL